MEPRFSVLYRGFCAIGGRNKENKKSKNTVGNAKRASKKASKATKKIEENKAERCGKARWGD